ncbi:MAG TPA: M20/M25/M40 family metallo-hydrolase, partial [Planctomycetota bacterium]|nr:M20/M25/M40 family metallo-hydrolase [Planctomycetota bacterium]
TTLEAARLLMNAGAKPKRTIRFMLWSGEEQGLLGSRAYIKAHPEENARISAVLVHDGGTNYVSGIEATRPMVSIFEKVFEPVVALNQEMPFKIHEVKGLTMGMGSDHDSYLMAGVPGFFWRQLGKANYNHTHHTQYDTFDQAIPEYQQHTSMVVAIGAYNIANLDALLPREGLTASRATGRRLGDLGVSLQDDGVTLKDVAEGKPAHKAGLRDGDRVLRIGTKDVTDYVTLRDALREAPQKAKWRVRRGDKEVEIEFAFEAGPAPAQDRRILGVNLEDDGSTLSEVVEGSPADAAGLKVGDRILRIGAKDVKDYDSLVEAIQTAEKKTTVRLRRGAKEMELPVTFER